MRPLFPRYGITRLARVTHLDTIGIPVWTAVRPNARTLAVSQGKGIDDAAAQASAVMESLELAVAERPAAPVRHASAEALRAEGRTTVLLPGLVRRGRQAPAPDRTMAWMPGTDLLTGAPAWLPADAVQVDHSRDLDDPGNAYWQSTDGLASGNCLEEAILHGLLERIERDATVLWQFRNAAEVAARALDPQSAGDAALSMLAERIGAAGLHLRLFDITSDIGVPVCFAVIAPADRPPRLHFDLVSGVGCHPDPVRAAIRAVTEAAQSRLTVIAGARDDFLPRTYRDGLRPDLLDYVGATIALRPMPARPALARADLLDHTLQRLRAAGIRSAFVVPLTDDETPFSVVKMVVEDLENPPGDRARRLGVRAVRMMVRLT